MTSTAVAQDIRRMSAKEIESIIVTATERRVLELNRKGVAHDISALTEPERRHNPVLLNLEKFLNWLEKAESYAIDKRLKKKEGKEFVPEAIDIADIFRPIETKEGTKDCKSIIILGSAGIGKTTLLHRLAQHELFMDKIVIIPEIRDFPLSEKITPSRALLSSTFPNMDENGMKIIYQWIRQNSQNVVILVDSLDTMPFDFEDERSLHYRDEDVGIDVVTHNLLSGKLLPGAQLISTSREHKVSKMHPSIHPDRCVLIDGLTKESSSDLIDGFLGEAKGAEVKKHITEKCPSLWPLLSIPVMLVFTIVGLTDEGTFKADSMSGILVKFFTTLIRSKHAIVNDIPLVLRKLMPMCLEGIRDGRVLFQPEHLRKYNVRPEEVTDLGILIPQSHGSSFAKLMQNDRFYLYFNHQTQQECLAAIHVLSMKKKEFETFVQNEIYDENFTVVRRVMCGILFSDDVVNTVTDVLTEISDIDVKRNILLESLGEAFERKNTKSKLLELLLDLAEAKEGVSELIRTRLKEIDLGIFPLNTSQVQAVASVLKQCLHLNQLNLSTCEIDQEKMAILESAVTQSDLKINDLSVAGNNLGINGAGSLARFAVHCEVKLLSFSKCKLENEHLEKFLQFMGSFKLKQLYCNSNNTLGSDGWYSLGKILDSDCQELRAADCNLSSDKVSKLDEGTGASKVKIVDFGGNDELDFKGWNAVGQLVRNHEVEELGAGLCDVGTEKIKNFLVGLGDRKMKKLSLSDMVFNARYSRSLLDLLHHITENLNIEGWEVNESEEQELQQKLNELHLPELTISLNNKKQLRASSAVAATGVSAASEDTGLPSVDEEPTAIETGIAALQLEENEEYANLMVQYHALVELIHNTIARKVGKISPDGGYLELYGCRFRFPPGAVDYPTDVEIFTSNNPENYPAFATPISLIYGCKPSRFNLPVEVSVLTWFKPRIKSNTVSAEVLVRSKSSKEWRTLQEVNVSSTGEITYQVSHFCDHVNVIFDRELGNGYFPCYNDVWIHNQTAVIIPFFCRKDQKFLEELQEKLKHQHTSIITFPEELEIYVGSMVELKIQWDDPSNLGMKIAGRHPIIFTEKELRKDKIHCLFKPIPDLTRLKRLNELTYRTEVRKADGNIDEDACVESLLSFSWPIMSMNYENELKEERNKRTTTINISADKVDVQNVAQRMFSSGSNVQISEEGVTNVLLVGAKPSSSQINAKNVKESETQNTTLETLLEGVTRT